MKARRSFIAAFVAALLLGGGYRFADAQQSGGSFIPSFAYTISSTTGWIFSTAPTITGGGTVVGSSQTATLTNKTLTSPTLTTATLTSPTITTPTMTSGVSGAGTYTFPSSTGGMPIVVSCGGTSGNANCANTATAATAHIVAGIANLSAGSAIISGISPTFTSTSTGFCSVIDTTPASGGSAKALITGVSSITITGTNNQAIAYVCVGY